jgi:replicative DNA helicase
MTVAASQIVLAETDVELTLLGSLFENTGSFDKYAHAIKSEWFGDEFARYLFEACQRIHDAGNRLTAPTIMAALPLDLGGVTRGEFYARACAAGLPDINIPSLVATLKDRWARRSIVDMAQKSSAAAVTFEADPYDIASACLLDLDRILEVKAEKVGGSLARATRNLIEDIESPNQQRGATTGIRILDVKLNGYRRGQLYVIAGRPGMGKSAFMCSSLRRTAQSGKGVAIFSLEMTAEEIACRCLSDGLDNVKAPYFGDILRGLMSEAQEADIQMAQDSLGGLPMLVDDDARQTWSQIVAKARQAKAKFEAQGIPLSVVCIDHMGLVTPSDRYRGNKVAEAGEISGQARALAKELDCCVVLLCQLSREVEKRDDKRPVMSDLRWSGEIEQDAHVIGFLYREAYYLAQDANADPYKVSEVRNRLEFLIRKNRNGETADVRLWCSIGHSMIRDE